MANKEFHKTEETEQMNANRLADAEAKERISGESQEGEVLPTETGGEIPAADPAYEAEVLASVAKSINPEAYAAEVAQIPSPEQQLDVPQAEVGADAVIAHDAVAGVDVETIDREYTEAEEKKRQERVASMREANEKQLTSSPRYKELYAKYAKPTEFIEGTMRVKERAPDPSFGRFFKVEGEAPSFPGSKIMNFERDGKTVKYALRRDQYGELQGSEFILQEKVIDRDSQTAHWNNIQSPTSNATIDPDRFRIPWTQQVHGDDLEEMEALLRARGIDV